MKEKIHTLWKFRGPRKKRSLKRMVILFIIFLWFLPIEALFLMVFSAYKNTYEERMERLICEGLAYSASSLQERIDQGIWAMQKPSYEEVWEDHWRQYQNGEIGRYTFFINVRNSLKGNFILDNRFDMYAFYLYDEGDEEPLSYVSREGISYEEYMRIAQPQIQKVIEKDSNYAEVHIIDNQIYLVRNLYTVKGYQRFGTLVVRMTPGKLMSEIAVENADNLVLSLNSGDERYYYGDTDYSYAAQSLYRSMYDQFNPNYRQQVNVIEGHDYKGFMYQKKLDCYSLGYYYILPKSELNKEFQDRYWIAFVATGCLLIIMFYSVYYMNKHIELPLLRVIGLSKKLEAGKVGTVLEGDPMPNTEFTYLADCFNDMSSQLKYLFDTVYKEQIAKKDAQIMALQAQINPHFLNNTLEMMNWQARMNNDIEVCKMIEALSIVFDHSINRDNAKTVYLSEELRCADAYLYIMSMRFGQRLKVEKEVDEELLRSRVPQLILQPLLENAILHGIERVRQGTIWLKVHRDKKNIYLDVINTGNVMSEKELEKVKSILDGTYKVQPHEQGKHTSIGISNVNKRIKLVYGENYGLSMQALEDGRTLSRITLQWIEGIGTE